MKIDPNLKVRHYAATYLTVASASLEWPSKKKHPTVTPREEGVVNFYYEDEQPYGCFSNFFPAVITDAAGVQYATSEHYFQAHKFVGSEAHFHEVRCMPTPMKVATAGRDRSRPLRRDWEDVKDRVMLDACVLKFSQHDALGQILLGTADLRLCENTANDSYWGNGGDGKGKNMLGQTLMRVRSILNGDEQHPFAL